MQNVADASCNWKHFLKSISIIITLSGTRWRRRGRKKNRTLRAPCFSQHNRPPPCILKFQNNVFSFSVAAAVYCLYTRSTRPHPKIMFSDVLFVTAYPAAPAQGRGWWSRGRGPCHHSLQTAWAQPECFKWQEFRYNYLFVTMIQIQSWLMTEFLKTFFIVKTQVVKNTKMKTWRAAEVTALWSSNCKKNS